MFPVASSLQQGLVTDVQIQDFPRVMLDAIVDRLYPIITQCANIVCFSNKSVGLDAVSVIDDAKSRC